MLFKFNDKVIVIYAADQSWFERKLIGKIGIILCKSRAVRYNVLIENKVYNLHMFDLERRSNNVGN